GKGRKDRTVPIREDVADLMRKYVQRTGRSLNGTGRLFRGHDRGEAKRKKKGLTERAVGSLIERLVDRADISGKRISPHSLRHTYAMRYLRNGGVETKLAELLGHTKLDTTKKYLDHLNKEELVVSVPGLYEGVV